MSVQGKQLPSDYTYEKSRNDMHTVSMTVDKSHSKEETIKAITQAVAEYCKANPQLGITTEVITYGGFQQGRQFSYMYCYISNRVLFNLLVGRSAEGVDLFELVYRVPSDPSSSKMTHKHGCFMPDSIGEVDITLEDLVLETSKAKNLTFMVQALDECKYAGMEVVKKWKDPLIHPKIGGDVIKFIPAIYKRELKSSLLPKVVCLPMAFNCITKEEIQTLLSKVCIRERNKTLYIKGTQITGTTPLLLTVEDSHYELHFTTDVLSKMCYLMLNNYHYENKTMQKTVLRCEFMHMHLGHGGRRNYTTMESFSPPHKQSKAMAESSCSRLNGGNGRGGRGGRGGGRGLLYSKGREPPNKDIPICRR